MTSTRISPGPPASAPALSRAHLWNWLDLLGPLLALFVIFGVFCLLIPGGSFARASNIETIARQTVVVWIASLGMTLIIITGGIDLSVGAIIALAGVTVGIVCNAGNTDPDHHPEYALVNRYPVLLPLAAALAGLLAGALCGLANGSLITGLKVVPFIVTLGTVGIFRGLSLYGAHEMAFTPPPTWVSAILAPLAPEHRWMLLPPGLWIAILLSAVMAVLLSYTRFGRHVFAVGSNEQTSRLCGVPINRVKILVYTLGGALAGLSGLMLYSRLNQADPSVANGLELDIIAAVVIGGGSLSGGRGSIFGTIVGAFIMSVIRAGCSQVYIPAGMRPLLRSTSAYGLPNWTQLILTGLIIVIAIALDRLRHRERS